MTDHMVTKAELAAELAALKQELAARQDAALAAATSRGDAATDPSGLDAGKAALADWLHAHGIDDATLDLDALWQKLSDEVGTLANRQPVLTAIAIFALGFMLGRSSR